MTWFLQKQTNRSQLLEEKYYILFLQDSVMPTMFGKRPRKCKKYIGNFNFKQVYLAIVFYYKWLLHFSFEIYVQR